MQSETVPTAGLPNLILVYPLSSIVERLDLEKPCPPSVRRGMKLYSTRPARIGIPTRSCVSPQVFYGSGRTWVAKATLKPPSCDPQARYKLPTSRESVR